MNKQLTPSTRQLTESGVIAAAYAALTVVLAPLGFGAMQVRLSETLTVLPAYRSSAVAGLTVGCFLANLIGLSLGANPAGAWDLLCGPAATAIAAVLTYALRGVRVRGLPLLSAVPPVLVNALVVGSELYVLYRTLPWWAYVLWVGAGEAVACLVGGTVLMAVLHKHERKFK